MPNSALARYVIWWSITLVSLIPFFTMVRDYHDESVSNIFDNLMGTSGNSAIVFLLITLAITPLRRWLTWAFTQFPNIKWGKRLSDWNILIRYRRHMGLMSFYYASIHMWVYLYYELGLIAEEFLYDVQARLHVQLGITTWLLLFVLAITSFKLVTKKMGVWWRRTHRLVYLCGLLSVTHIFLASKVTNISPWFYAVFLVIFLMHRVIVANIRAFRRKDDTGMIHSRGES